jgi:predicted amidophosphoribosyltransferase
MLLDAVCGSRCAGCGRLGAGAICSRCRIELARTARPPDAAFFDQGAAARLVRAAKHGHWRNGGVELAAWLVDRIAIPDVELVTWVPADPRRRARRGGCLPERLARAVARRLDVPAHAVLERHVHGSQRGLDRAERRIGAHGSYRAIESAVGRLAGGTRVLLLDDVRTTGATLEACASVLTSIGVHVVARAVVGVGTPDTGSRSRAAGGGVCSRAEAAGKIPATSAEILLTTRADGADTLRQDR